MKPTIHDIAKKAGVSATTVSKVINNKGRISEKTRSKIMHIIKELHYQPSILASAMKGKNTFTIGMLIPDMNNPVYSEYLKYIEAYGQELGFNIVMCSTGNNPEKEAKQVNLLRQRHVDGFIIASKFKNEEVLQELIFHNVPLVLFAHERPAYNVDCVTVDDYLGGYKVTEYLLSLGHRRIGIIMEDSPSSLDRLRGYKEALTKSGVKIQEDLIYKSSPTIEGAEEQAKKLLSKKDIPTAVFGCNDVLAIGTMMAAKECGVSIPHDLSIIGFDNTFMCRLVEPQLTSVSMPLEEMGKQAVDLLIEKIKKEQADVTRQRIIMHPNIVIRQSICEIK
ncbi:LacI family DNA-binding transcriptional regulator [Priestia megaterium]|uniref:LacI family DNA-binding transcriptional regulator n=1 Tax=Priestia megaterium TaxID=1404 RepID=UPI003CFBE570